eukprot:6006357-Alexandrium_andersonii.AAC.1
MGTLARAPPAMMASPSLLLGSSRWSLWLSSGQRGSACAHERLARVQWGERASAGCPIARAHIRGPERHFPHP